MNGSDIIGDIVSILSALNKLSIIAFGITLLFIFYEISLLKKEKIKKDEPSIPEFQGKMYVNKGQTFIEKKQNEDGKMLQRPHMTPIIIAGFFALIFGLVSILGFFNAKNTTNSDNGVQNPGVQFITSNGIKIFNNTWSEIETEQELNTVKPGEKIYIGVESIPEADIDRARIRINEQDWDIKHITTTFNEKKGFYYTDYMLSSTSSKLKIEAQLHSQTDGWLGE